MERMSKSRAGSSSKIVLDEMIGFMTEIEDPALSLSRARGWYLMSRCTVHVCNSRDMFDTFRPLSNHEVILENDNHVDVLGTGTVKLRLTTGKILTLENVFHMPEIRKCCVSTGRLTQLGFAIGFGGQVAVIKMGDDIIGEGYNEDGLFRLRIMEERKIVLNETISFMTINEDPVLSLSRAPGWYLFTRCTRHVSNSRDMFDTYHPLSNHEVILENGNHVDVLGIGTVKLQLTTGKVLTLANVFHMPAIRKCCVSVGQLTGNCGFTVCFMSDKAVLMKGDEIVGEAYMEDELFQLSIVEG